MNDAYEEAAAYRRAACRLMLRDIGIADIWRRASYASPHALINVVDGINTT